MVFGGSQVSMLPLPMPGYRHVAPFSASAGGTGFHASSFVCVFGSPLWKCVDLLMR